MKPVPTPSLLVRNLLALAGVGVLWTTFGCGLGLSDVVSRSPDASRGTGGSSGWDALGVETSSSDTSLLSSPRFDGADTFSATEDAPAIENEAGPGHKSDAADAKSDAGPDTVNASGEAGRVSKGYATCLEDGYQFCDGFEDGTSLWTETGGQWEVSEADSGSDANMVYGPTDAIGSIAFVPTAAWQDMTVEARVLVTSFDQASATNRVVLYARYQDTTHFYAVALRGDGKLALKRNATAFGTVANISVTENEWHVLKLKVSGPADNVVVEGSLDGTLLAAATDTTGSLTTDTGTVGLGVYGGMMAVFDDVRVSSP